MFGVLDGHGGKAAAEYVANALPRAFEFELGFNMGSYPPGEKIDAVIWNSLKNCFARLDENFFLSTNGEDRSGTTATVILIHDKKAWCANLGDSRSIFITEQGSWTPLSFDQRVKNDQKSIQKRRGKIVDNRLAD